MRGSCLIMFSTEFCLTSDKISLVTSSLNKNSFYSLYYISLSFLLLFFRCFANAKQALLIEICLKKRKNDTIRYDKRKKEEGFYPMKDCIVIISKFNCVHDYARLYTKIEMKRLESQLRC